VADAGDLGARSAAETETPPLRQHQAAPMRAATARSSSRSRRGSSPPRRAGRCRWSRPRARPAWLA